MRRSMRGQAMVELAICLPVLVALLVACADLSSMYRTWQLADTAAAEAARYAAQNPSADADEISEYARLSIGRDDAVVSVDDAAESASPADVRVMGTDGRWREAEASVTMRTRRVGVTLGVRLVGGLGTWRATATHSSVSSEVS